MPIQVYVNRDSGGRPAAPEYSHEMVAIIDILRRLWNAFHHHSAFYGIAVNLQQPSVDLLIISERGVGVMELKHYYGRITCRSDGTWYAGPIRIQAGVAGKGFQNPHEQVQAYVEEIRKQLITPPPWQEPWLPGKAIDWPAFKFHTSVCFTHPDADLEGFDDFLRRRCRPIVLPWEDVSVFRVDEAPTWVTSLRFEVGGGREKGYHRHRLTPAKIERILTELLGLSPWTEINDLLPLADPFGYLTLLDEDEHNQIFALEQDDLLIGRDLTTCDILIPDRFLLVSRVHARLTRSVQGVFLEDLTSTNGTFLDGKRVSRKQHLQDGQIITLGGAEPAENVCHLVYSVEVDTLPGLEQTLKLSLHPRDQG